MNKEVETEELLTKDEVIETLQAFEKALDIRDAQIKEGVFDITKFSSGMAKAGMTNPYSQNELMKRLNIATTSIPDSKEIDEALANPMENEGKLVNYGQSYYFSSLMYKRNQEYLANLPAFDLELTCINAEPEDYKTSKYKKDYEEIKKFLDCFDYREQFKNITWNMIMNESYFGMFRELGERSIIQEFPSKYAMITGRFEYGLLYDIDMGWFQQSEADLDCYPDWIKEKYRQVFQSGTAKR